MSFDNRLSYATVGAICGISVGAVVVTVSQALAAPSMLHAAQAVVKPATTVVSRSPILPRQIGWQSELASHAAAYSTSGEEALPAEVQTTNWQPLQWACVGFAGMMGAATLALRFLQPKPVAMVAVTGEPDMEEGLNRRQALFGASLLASAAAAAPAHAIFGLGDDPVVVYTKETTEMLNEIKAVLSLDKEDPAKPAKVKTLRNDMKVWVAKYRRDPQFSGRASFGNLYSVINSIAGHYTNFGTTTPIPKKRAAQIVNEIGLAEQLLSKGR